LEDSANSRNEAASDIDRLLRGATLEMVGASVKWDASISPRIVIPGRGAGKFTQPA